MSRMSFFLAGFMTGRVSLNSLTGKVSISARSMTDGIILLTGSMTGGVSL